MAQGTTNLIQKDTGDGTILIFPWAYSAIAQGTWVFSISSGYPYNGFWYNSTANEGDQIDYKVWLSKGIWTLSLHGVFNSTYGFCEALLDGTVVAALDLYDVSTTSFRFAGFSPAINITTTGLKTLSLLLKTAVGGDQQMSLDYLMLQRVN